MSQTSVIEIALERLLAEVQDDGSIDGVVAGLQRDVELGVAVDRLRDPSVSLRLDRLLDPARLNFGDCFAADSGEPLLFTGDDFTETDIDPALGP